MRLLLKGLLLIAVATLSVLLLSSGKGKAKPAVASGRLQSQERLIVRKRDFNPPVVIRSVKTKGRLVPLSKKFTDDDDWLKGFAVLVRNQSNKTVTHVGIELLFRGEQLPAGWFLNYGPNPFHVVTGTSAASTVENVLPGDEVEIRLEDAQLDRLAAFLRKAGFTNNVHTVEIRVNTLGFSDGTAWFGKMMKRDPSSSTGWMPIAKVSMLSKSQPIAKRNQSFFEHIRTVSSQTQVLTAVN